MERWIEVLVEEMETLSLEERCEFLTQGDLQYLGVGTFRFVFALDDRRVLKCARGPYGIDHNAREVVYFKAMPGAPLAQVLAWHSGYEWTIMERVQTLRELSQLGRDYKPTPAQWERLRKSASYTQDLHSDNVGLREDGSLVIVDYGFATVSKE